MNGNKYICSISLLLLPAILLGQTQEMKPDESALSSYVIKTSKMNKDKSPRHSVVYSRDGNFEKGMKSGFDTFTNGKTFDEWIKGAKILSKLGETYPDKWLPEYWSSYLYTQLTFAIPKNNPPKGVTSQSILDESQKNFAKAFRKVKNMTPEIRSDFHVLQSLIYDFRNWSSKDKALKARMLSKREAEVRNAIRLSPNSPLVDVIIGTDLIKRKDFTSVFAGRILLLHAQDKFNQRLVPRYMSSHWNEQWINFWLSKSKKEIKTLTGGKSDSKN